MSELSARRLFPLQQTADWIDRIDGTRRQAKYPSHPRPHFGRKIRGDPTPVRPI